MASITIDRNGFLANVFLARKGPCRAGSTAALTLSGEQTIDGVAVVAEDRVLAKDQSPSTDNGIWIVKSAEWERAKDFNQRGHANRGTRAFITDGTTNALTEWYVSTTGNPVPGQDAIDFAQIPFQPLDAGLTDIAGLTPTDSNIIVGDGTTWVAESGATARSSLGLGTGNSPQFTAIEVGDDSDTTITRAGAGDIAIEGNTVYRAGGTDVAVADGGTGRSTATAYGVLCGGTTSTAAHQSVASVGASGQVLTSNGAGSLPTFQSAPGNFNQQVFTASGTWNKPSAGAIARIQVWGAGGGGGVGGSGDPGGGGGGGGYNEDWILLSSLGSTETVTIGAGGTGQTGGSGAGTAGGNSSFGSHVTGFGGGGGFGNTASSGSGGGGGGGAASAGATATAGTGGNGGGPGGGLGGDSVRARAEDSPSGGGGGGSAQAPVDTAGDNNTSGGNSFWGGGGGGGGNNGDIDVGGSSVWGGGGGASSDGTAGASAHGGNGGATGTAGTAPGGGGGGEHGSDGDAGDGARGEVIVTVF